MSDLTGLLPKILTDKHSQLLYSINNKEAPANTLSFATRAGIPRFESEAPEPPAMRWPRAEYTIRSELAPICPQHWNKSTSLFISANNSLSVYRSCRLRTPQIVDQSAGQIAGQERGSLVWNTIRRVERPPLAISAIWGRELLENINQSCLYIGQSGSFR